MNPERVGPFLIAKKIGAGGMGTVYRAHHEDTEREVAVKVLPASLAREEGFVRRFTREIDAMKKVSNEHIVEFFENGCTEDGTHYYAMEYVEGETLTLRLGRERKLPWREVIDFTRQICSALKAAHDSGVVHRDLKPSNLLITPEGIVKLTDFGIAHVFATTRLTRTGGVIGTAEYMSPEQAAGRRTTKRSDLYSLGAVMYVMLTGRPPFTGQTTTDITHKHLYGRFDLPSRYSPDIPKQLEDVVVRLMEKNPDKRFPDAFVLRKALGEIERHLDFITDTEATRVIEGGGYIGADQPTMTDEVVGNEALAGPGSATMMRDLMRAEIARDAAGTPLSQFLNNTWVLVGMLGLIVAGVFYMARSGEASPEERFEEGVALMEKKPGNGWLRARDEFFEPLLEEDAEAWEERVTPYLTRITRYAEARAFDRRTRSFDQSADEPTRLLSDIVRDAENGRFERARRRVDALLELIGDDAEFEYVRSVAEKLRDELGAAGGTAPTDAFVRKQMRRADTLVAEGKTRLARSIYQGLLILYDEGPEPLAPLLQECGRLLKGLEGASSPGGNNPEHDEFGGKSSNRPTPGEECW